MASTSLLANIADGIDAERHPVTMDDLAQAGVSLEESFPGCSLDEFSRYDVLTEGGWFTVIKHVPTLTVVSRKPAALLGPIRLTSHGLRVD